MKKVFLFVATILATTVMAQNVSLSELLISPATKDYNVFTSSIEDIAKVWECSVTPNENGSSCTFNGGKEIAYADVFVTPIRLNTNADGRSIKIFLFVDMSVDNKKIKSSTIADMLISDFSKIGIEMPAIKDGRSIQKMGLPEPFKSIIILVTDSGVILSYSFNEGQIPNL